jgi:hypothetical protein
MPPASAFQKMLIAITLIAIATALAELSIATARPADIGAIPL